MTLSGFRSATIHSSPIISWPKHIELVGPAAWKFGGTNPNKIQSFEVHPLQSSHSPTAPLISVGKKELWNLWGEELWSTKARGWVCSRASAEVRGVERGMRSAWRSPWGRTMNPFKETCKYIQEYRYFSTTGYCAFLGCQNSNNCYTASYWVEDLECTFIFMEE